jgi:Rieske Fe-S protein
MTDVQTRTEPDTERQPGASDCAEASRVGLAGSRRAVLAGAGALGATCVLAGCGAAPSNSSTNTAGSDYTDNPLPAGSSAGAAGSSGAGSTATVLAAVADVPSGGGIIKGDLVITQPQAGTFKAFSKVCTHAGCFVNKVDGGTISCPCHGSTYSIEDGSPTGGPAQKPLPETKVKVDGTNIVKV